MPRPSLLLLPAILLLAACTSSGGNPFAREKPFVPTAVPADFAVVVDEYHDTFYTRQHIQQVITAADSTSRTTYTTYRDFNNTPADRFIQETPLSAVQLQTLWNEVARHGLLKGSHPWLNTLSDADLYKRNTYSVQIQANGQTSAYQQTNGFAPAVRPMMLQASAVRLPLSQNATTPVVTSAQPPARPVPAIQP